MDGTDECRPGQGMGLAGAGRQANQGRKNPDELQYWQRGEESLLRRGCTPENTLSHKWASVQITKVANGFCLQIGCKTFIAKTWLEASTGLAEYWQDPGQAEKKYTTS